MTIREATEKDVPQIAELVTSLSDYYLNDPEQKLPLWFSDTLSINAFTSRMADPGYLNFVYEQSGEIKAYISLKGRAHLYHLFVSECHQGKGIARRLWERVLEHSQSDCITVRSSIYAVPVYKKLGFSLSGPVGLKEGIAFQAMEFRRNAGKDTQ